jgi:hypothetical protein
MEFKSIVRGRFGTEQLACGEFSKPVESSFSGRPGTACNAKKDKGLRGFPSSAVLGGYKLVTRGKLLSEETKKKAFSWVFRGLLRSCVPRGT